MHDAARRGDLAAVQRYTGKKRPWHPFSELGKRLAAERDCEGNSPLHLAMHEGNWEIAQYLLDGDSLGAYFVLGMKPLRGNACNITGRGPWQMGLETWRLSRRYC